MIIFVLYKNNELYGVYDEPHKYENLVKGDDKFKVIMYKQNSNHIIGEYTLDHLQKKKEEKKENKENKENKEKEVTNDEEKKETEEELKKTREQKVFDNNVKNIRKKQKELIEESKRKYECNLNLYKEFKERVCEENFKIPEMFENIYDIMMKLEEKGKLNWESYSLLYREMDMHGRNKTIHDVLDEYEQTIGFMEENK
jgi:hypothetical protein